MQFGLFTSMGNQTWPGVLDLWRRTEATGWDLACLTDHFMPNTPAREGSMMECWTTLSALAPLVPRLRIGTIVLGNTYRHPAVLAKMAAQLDIICEGRLVLGMGAGWQENEHDAYGIPFYTMRERLDRLEEACAVMRSLWTNERSDFDGRFYQLSDAPLDPKPLQKPHPELLIGGGGERVTLRIVAKHADHWNVWGGPQVLAHKGAILEQHCEKLGRDPGTITRSANMALLISDDRGEVDAMVENIGQRIRRSPEEARDLCLAGSITEIIDKLGALAESKVDTLFIPTLFRPIDALRDDLDRFIEEAAPALR